MQEYLARYRVDVYAFGSRVMNRERSYEGGYPFVFLDHNDSPEHRFTARNDKEALRKANRFMRERKESNNDSIKLVELLRITKIR